MDTSTESVISSVISIMRSMYTNQVHEINRKIENLNLINIENLKQKIEKETKPQNLPKDYNNIISIIEEVIQD